MDSAESGTPTPSAARRTLSRSPLALFSLAVALAIVALAYARVSAVPFLWDDRSLIASANGLEETRSALDVLTEPFLSDPVRRDVEYYRPLTMLSYLWDQQLWQGRAAGMHLTNLMAHLAVCALLFALARRSGASALASGLAAAAFGVFPRLTESVGIVSGRTDVLAALGALGCLALHRSGAEHAKRRALAALSLLLGLLCKEIAIAALPVLVLRGAPLSRAGFRHWRVGELVPSVVAAAFYGALRIVAVGVEPRAEGSFLERVPLALQSVGEYVAMWLDPIHPSLRIGIVGIPELGTLLAGTAGVILWSLGMAWCWRSASRESRHARGALALMGFGLLPVLHLVFIPVDTVAADRFLYLPSAGLAILLALAMSSLPDGSLPGGSLPDGSLPGGRLPVGARRVAMLCVAAITISGAFATSARITGWSDEARFWKDGVAEASRGDCQPLMGLAGLQLDRGQTRLALSTYELALVEARKVPSVPASVARRRGVMAGIGVALTRLGRREEAIGVYRELQRDQPENDAVRVQLARLLAEDAKPSVQVPNPLPIRSAKLSK